MKGVIRWTLTSSYYRITLNNRYTCHHRLLQTLHQKKSITSFYTPFDNITGQTISEFHEEQKILVSEDEDGDGKKKNNLA